MGEESFELIQISKSDFVYFGHFPNFRNFGPPPTHAHFARLCRDVRMPQLVRYPAASLRSKKRKTSGGVVIVISNERLLGITLETTIAYRNCMNITKLFRVH